MSDGYPKLDLLFDVLVVLERGQMKAGEGEGEGGCELESREDVLVV